SVVLDRWESTRVGASVPRFVERIEQCDRVIVVGTPLYRKKYENKDTSTGYVVAAEVELISNRLLGTEAQKETVLPLAWRVRQGPKGPLPEELHIALVELVRACLPEGTPVVLLGDGEFDGTTLQQTRNEAGWRYTCRTAQSTVAAWQGAPLRLDALGACS